MASRRKYAIHSDFRHFPRLPFPFGRFGTGLANGLLRLDTFLRQRGLEAGAKAHSVASPDGTRVRVLQFDPDRREPGTTLPAVLYYHGGAFVLTYASTHVEAVHHYANAVQCSVFLVDYRLAPRHPFPRGFEDCDAALRWVAARASSLGVDPGRLAVMGDSAGGALAAGVAQKALDDKAIALRAQVLVYPVIDRACSSMSATEFVDTPLFDGVANRKMWATYLRDCAPGTAPAYASPADRRELGGLPSAYVETAEFDPLRDEARDYATRLQTAGVRVELRQTHGTVHGYDTVLTSALARESRQRRVEFLRAALA